MTHVFIVNDQTFKIHLEYMFAGTGSANDATFLSNIEINNTNKNKKEWIPSATERNLVAMIADVSRIRPGDNIIFYLQATTAHPGRFFGVFKAAGKAFYCPGTESELNGQLGKDLYFRVLIESTEVYASGVTEHDALDNLEGISHPSEMCWSLIYRKLKGNRGCTMITDYEAERLIEKIKSKNNGISISGSGFTFDAKESKIAISDEKKEYSEKQDSLLIKDRLLIKAKRKNAFEVHLQAYIMQNIDKKPLIDFFIPNLEAPFWIGNEVSCGVGMQRIDVMTMQEDNNDLFITIAELKCTEPYKKIVTEQLPWYIDWVSNYIAPLYPDKIIKIVPMIIAKKFKKETDAKKFKNSCLSFTCSEKNNVVVSPIRFISFSTGDDLSFKKVF